MHPFTRSGFPERHAVAADAVSGRRSFAVALLLSLLMIVAALTAVVTVPPPAAHAQMGATATAEAGDDQLDAADVAELANPSVVTVYTYSPRFSPGSTGREPTGAGSGWAYTDDGYVITNAHVVLEAETVKVMTYAGDLIPATVVGTDWYQDVAVLKLNPEDGQELPPAATVGDSSDVRAGDQVVAIGTPLGQYANTVTVGTVGAVGRTLNSGSGYTLGHLIQHDASLSPGNSGGPLFSMQGEVVGMNVAKLDSLNTGQPAVANIGFAIDGNTVVKVADQIIADGVAVRPFLGITSNAQQDGQVVRDVEDGSPAADAGLQPGDVITAMDGQRVNVDSWFVDQLYAHDPGDTVTLTIERNGETLTAKVALGTIPAPE